MARAKLNKGEIAGIRLLADLFVISDLKKNVLSKHEGMTPELLLKLTNDLKSQCPKVFAAEIELQKQIKEVRKIWLDNFIGSKETDNE